MDANGFVSGLDDGTRLALQRTPRNVIIFETDGSPDEIFTNASSDSAAQLSLTNSDDIGSTDDGRACSNLTKVAANAKAAGITIITIGFGGVNSATCGTKTVRSVLAGAASTQAAVTGSGVANSTCSTEAGVAAENSDDDFLLLREVLPRSLQRVLRSHGAAHRRHQVHGDRRLRRLIGSPASRRFSAQPR